MVEIHGPKGIPSIGEPVTLNCTAAVLLGVTESPVLTLKHPNGTNISRNVGMSVSVVLDPVHIGDVGEYVCTGKIEFSDLENVTTIVVVTKQSLTLKCKPIARITHITIICDIIDFLVQCQPHKLILHTVIHLLLVLIPLWSAQQLMTMYLMVMTYL